MKNITKKGKFSGKGKVILGADKPAGLADFLDNTQDNASVRNDVDTQIRQNANVSIQQTVEAEIRVQAVREDFRFPEPLAEQLRHYAFDKRRTKTEVVIQALEEFFDRQGYRL